MKAVAALALVLTATMFVPPATAGLNPYVRIAIGPSQFKMAAVNDRIHQDQKFYKDAGFDPDFKDIGLANGPSASAGLWLLPVFRIGASYSLLNASRDNRLHVPGAFFYDSQVNFRMHEVGAEAAFRIQRWAGLTFGGNYGRGAGSAVLGSTLQQASSDDFLDVTGHAARDTYGFFLGIDQSNEHGVIGYVRAGYRKSDMGSMIFNGVESDGFTSTPVTYSTVDMDFSGYYLVFGTGFDLRH